MEVRKWSLGLRVLSALDTKRYGSLWTSWEMWVLVKPWFLNRVRTEFGLSGLSNWIFLAAEIAVSGDKPHELIK